MHDRTPSDPVRLQGLYYAVTGMWPIVHLASFMAITGRKRDTWLVKTVGGLIAAIGVTLLAGRSGPARPTVSLLGVLSALVLAAVDVVFVGRRTIRPVYLLDAAAELALAAAVAGSAGRDPRTDTSVAMSPRRQETRR